MDISPLVTKLIEFSVSMAIMAFMLWYFMQYTKQKDQQIREEHNREIEYQREQQKEFIAIIRESNEVHVKTTLALNEMVQRIDRMSVK